MNWTETVLWTRVSEGDAIEYRHRWYTVCLVEFLPDDWFEVTFASGDGPYTHRVPSNPVLCGTVSRIPAPVLQTLRVR